jgi:N6-L-threonylcarbamoyladenine synthase
MSSDLDSYVRHLASPDPQKAVVVLGLETSCDETAVAIVRFRPGQAPQNLPEILADEVASQTEEHQLYGGVVPEIAARAHAERLQALMATAIARSGLPWSAIDAVAATAGPGLIGGVMTGLNAAKGLAVALNRPLIAVNHLEGHALSPRLSRALPFPYLLLLVSGGHCQFILVRGLGEYQRLGSTIDDAAGEAFDKTAKLLGLGFPGGPAVERAARHGDPQRFKLPRSLLDQDGERSSLDMSFSGLKSAVRRFAEANAPLSVQDRADLCASFQAAVGDILSLKASRAMAQVKPIIGLSPVLVVAGGVAANQFLRARLTEAAQALGFDFQAPPLRHCTDNAAMIALSGAERLCAGWVDDLGVPARARWPLDTLAAQTAPLYGTGKKGAKA